jgi:hypothetical protein
MEKVTGRFIFRVCTGANLSTSIIELQKVETVPELLRIVAGIMGLM